MLTVYVDDRPVRALVLDLSDAGLRLEVVAGRAPAAGAVVQLEIGLPGVAEPIWASGTIRYQRRADLAAGLGVRFLAMATAEARRIRDFCVEARHRQLASLLARVAGRAGHLHVEAA